MKAQVLLPKIFNFSFTYNSNNIPIKIGDLVEVPFGKNKEIGVIWKNKNTELKNIKIKNISKKIKDYSIDQNLIDFVVSLTVFICTVFPSLFVASYPLVPAVACSNL